MENIAEKIEENRQFLKADFDRFAEIETDQDKKVAMPPIEIPPKTDCRLISLPPIEEVAAQANKPLGEILRERKSRRKFNEDSYSLQEMALLCYFTQGIREVRAGRTLRTVPSAGNRHPFESYIFAARVESLQPAVYRYLPVEHALELRASIDAADNSINTALRGQLFNAAAVFFWSVLPYRSEWRYSALAHKSILLDAGHLCQNLYLVSEAVGGGCCGIGAYDQKIADRLLNLDGEQEFVIYAAVCGKIDDK